MKILINLKNLYQKVQKKNVKLFLLNLVNLHKYQQQQQMMKIILKLKLNLLKMLLKNYYVQDVFYVVHMYMVII